MKTSIFAIYHKRLLNYRNILDYRLCQCLDHSLTQVQEEPTRYNNLLDLTFTNNPSLIRSCSCIPGISDHEAVVVDSIIRPSYTPTKKRKMFCYKKANWDGLNADCAVLSQQIKTKYDTGECVINLWNLCLKQG